MSYIKRQFPTNGNTIVICLAFGDDLKAVRYSIRTTLPDRVMEISQNDILILVEKRMDGEIHAEQDLQLESAVLANPQTRKQYAEMIESWLEFQMLFAERTARAKSTGRQSRDSKHPVAAPLTPPSSSAGQA